mgnify:CR=1 FL=1
MSGTCAHPRHVYACAPLTCIPDTLHAPATMRAPACNAGLRALSVFLPPFSFFVRKCLGGSRRANTAISKGRGGVAGSPGARARHAHQAHEKSFQGKRTASGDPAPTAQAVRKQAGGIPRRARCHHLERHLREPHARTRGRSRRVQRVAFRAKASQSLRRSLTTEALRPRGPRKAGRHPEGPKAYPPPRPPRARAFFHPVRTPTGVVVPRSRPARLVAKHGRGLPTPAPPCTVDAPHVRAATLAHPCRPDAPSARPGVTCRQLRPHERGRLYPPCTSSPASPRRPGRARARHAPCSPAQHGQLHRRRSLRRLGRTPTVARPGRRLARVRPCPCRQRRAPPPAWAPTSRPCPRAGPTRQVPASSTSSAVASACERLFVHPAPAPKRQASAGGLSLRFHP